MPTPASQRLLEPCACVLKAPTLELDSHGPGDWPLKLCAGLDLLSAAFLVDGLDRADRERYSRS
jgi:hypothetical protein